MAGATLKSPERSRVPQKKKRLCDWKKSGGLARAKKSKGAGAPIKDSCLFLVFIRHRKKKTGREEAGARGQGTSLGTEGKPTKAEGVGVFARR